MTEETMTTPFAGSDTPGAEDEFGTTAIPNFSWMLPSTANPVEEAARSSRGSNDKQQVCLLYHFIISFLLDCSLVLFGLVGNGLVCLVLWKFRSKNATSYLLLSLAFFDTIVLLVWGIMRGSPALCKYLETCTHYLKFGYRQMITHFWPVGSFAHLCGIYTVLLVTFHRFVAVCLPHKAKTWCQIRNARLGTLCIVVGSFFYTLPRFLDDETVQRPNATSLSIVQTDLGRDDDYDMAYNIVLYYIVIYLLPFTLLTVMTLMLIRALRISNKKRATMTKSGQEDNDLTFTLVIVVVVFMFCQVTNPIRRILVSVLPKVDQACGTFYYYYEGLSSTFIIFNSAVNFVIYCVCGRRFRRDLMKKLGLKGRSVEPGSASGGSTAQSNLPDSGGQQGQRQQDALPSVQVS